MIKKQVDIILEHQLKRRKKKIKLISISILLIIIGMSLILTFRYLSQNYYLNYTEQANIDYKVYLKNNDFYDVDYLGPNNNVIASLIQKCFNRCEYSFPDYIPVYLTGGGLSYLKGARDYLSKKLGRKVEIIAPALPQLNRPHFSTALGVLDIALDIENGLNNTFLAN